MIVMMMKMMSSLVSMDNIKNKRKLRSSYFFWHSPQCILPQHYYLSWRYLSHYKRAICQTAFFVFNPLLSLQMITSVHTEMLTASLYLELNSFQFEVCFMRRVRQFDFRMGELKGIKLLPHKSGKRIARKRKRRKPINKNIADFKMNQTEILLCNKPSYPLRPPDRDQGRNNYKQWEQK